MKKNPEYSAYPNKPHRRYDNYHGHSSQYDEFEEEFDVGPNPVQYRGRGQRRGGNRVRPDYSEYEEPSYHEHNTRGRKPYHRGRNQYNQKYHESQEDSSYTSGYHSNRGARKRKQGPYIHPNPKNNYHYNNYEPEYSDEFEEHYQPPPK